MLHHGSNLTGEWMDVAFPHFDKTKTKADMIETVETGQPVYRKGRPLMTYEKSRNRFPGSAPRHLVGVPVNPRILDGDRDEDGCPEYDRERTVMRKAADQVRKFNRLVATAARAAATYFSGGLAGGLP